MNHLTYLVILRPSQWIKNLIMFFPPFLGGALFTSSCITVSSFVSFISFCCVSSSLYIYNDLNDLKKDVLHPVKHLRPLASGVITKEAAIAIALSLCLLGFMLAFIVVRPLIPYLLAYGALTVVYTKWLKNLPILDLFCISCGFLIRLLAGGALFDIVISEWLFLSVFFLSLFLSTGKRLSEQQLLGAGAKDHRSSLCYYPEGTLDAILQVTAATVLLTYTMYTLAHPHLVYTVPLCAFGLFRYILRVKSGKSGDPTESLLKDLPLMFVSGLWALLVAWSIYR
jgi:4-hydroxybenzoate polyprenyltransferase